MRGSILLLAGLVLGGAGGIGAGLVLGGDDSGPQAPAAAPITAPVERRVVQDAITLDCTVERRTNPIPYSPASDGAAVVTLVPPPRDRAVAGGVLAEVSGRPVFALAGPFGLYRDLGPGDRGRDVGMLQHALADAGYAVRADGVFGDGTRRALTELYRDADYRPPTRRAEVATAAAAPPTPAATPTPAPSGSPSATPTPAPSATPVSREEIVALRSELVVLPSLPRRLTARLGVGAKVTDHLGSYIAPGTTARCSSPRSAEVRPGAVVTFTSPARLVGTVRDAAAPAPTQGGDSGTAAGGSGETSVAVSLPAAADKLEATEALAGRIVLAGGAQPVLAVPAGAVGGAGAQGALTVRQGRQDRVVQVVTGTVAGGYVQVTPVAGQRLAEGENVVIGAAS